MKILVVSIVLFFSSKSIASNVIKHIQKTNHSEQQSYFIDLLDLALQQSSDKYGQFELQGIGLPMVQKREFQNLNKGTLDVLWAMTSEQAEANALPIRIPLLKGLLGYRVLVIRKDQSAKFSSIEQISELKKLVAVQGHGWTDYVILQQNGFNVVEDRWYNTIFKSLSKGFYDYYPRSIIEAWSEMAHFESSKLAIDAKHLLKYPTAIYFFVHNDNLNLAERIEFGLLTAIKNGSFERLFVNYPSHAKAFEKVNFKGRIVHNLSNPLLPKETPLADKKLWFNNANY